MENLEKKKTKKNRDNIKFESGTFIIFIYIDLYHHFEFDASTTSQETEMNVMFMFTLTVFIANKGSSFIISGELRKKKTLSITLKCSHPL